MTYKKWMTKKFLIAPVAGAILSAGILIGCTIDNGSEAREGSPEGVTISRDIGGEAKGEHGSSPESGRESGTEGAEGSGGSEGPEGSGTMLAPDATFDMTRAGARLIMNYDPAANAFIGTVENTTNNTLTNVRIEVHLSNGAELGPTTPVDMAPGEVMDINLPSTPESFTGWTPHAEVGSGEGGGEGSGEQAGGESGPDGPEGPESGSEAAREAAMSSPITPLDQTWNGVLGGLAISARYDTATQSVHTTAQNTTSQTLCYVQTEPHLKSGTQTVGELGPGKMGDLAPGQQATSVLPVSAEPELAGVAYDGYLVHMEVFDCGGPGPQPHTSAEGGSGEGAGGEGHGPGGEGSGSEGSGGSEEGSGAMLAPNETFDMTRGGARLIMNYDPATNAFVGTVENTTNNTLTNVRIEVHLSNGTELGPTTPVDMAPGEVMNINLPSTPEPFTGWTPHAEVGSGEGGGEHAGGAEGPEGSGNEGPEGSEGSGSEEGSSAMLAPNETFDATRGGARLIMSYDPTSNAFKGIVQNTTGSVLTNLRIEVHLSNGTELGPTTPVDMAPSQALLVMMPSTPEPFTGWIAHAEVGGGESGGEHGSGASGSERGGGEHGSGGESRGEHGSGGERKGGG